MLSFNIPPCGKASLTYIELAVHNNKISGDGEFTKASNKWIEANTGTCKALLTTSCTHALEMAAMLCGIEHGDEVIMPSYTFVSTANAFVLQGAKIIFVDIRPDTMNMDERLIEAAVTERTKAIVPVHYAGVGCDMVAIMSIAKKYNLLVIEDAAQGVMSSYRGQYLGSIGTFGCFSFHETKNYSMGEGGALLINDPSYIERAEIIREKGTDRSRFFRGQIDKYTWVDKGSSYLPSELNAAYLWGQLEMAEEINSDRLCTWNRYAGGLKLLENKGYISLPYIPVECKHNAHMFYIKLENLQQRTAMIDFLHKRNIISVFHYVPLHSAHAGLEFGRFFGVDKYTTKESERLVRLPMYYGLTKEDCERVIEAIHDFFK